MSQLPDDCDVRWGLDPIVCFLNWGKGKSVRFGWSGFPGDVPCRETSGRSLGFRISGVAISRALQKPDSSHSLSPDPHFVK